MSSGGARYLDVRTQEEFAVRWLAPPLLSCLSEGAIMFLRMLFTQVA